jgi:methionyl-tRNA formyltransferase
MNKSGFRIIFLGTPDFAVASLKKLVENNWNIVAVVTAPDKPSGRGQKVSSSPVKEYVEQKSIPVLQPTNLKDSEFISRLKTFNAHLQIVVAFRMLPREVWQMPRLGTFNLHASLLPNYRGAAPINWAIINGEKETGVTTFFLRHEIDEGEILLQEKELISPEDTASNLHDRLMMKGADLVNQTVSLIFERKENPYEQILSGKERNAPKLNKEMCRINWSNSSKNIVNLIRGLAMYPGAWTELNGIQYKIYKASRLKAGKKSEPGSVISDSKNFLHIATNDGIISILEIQKEGKRKMGIKEFLVGNKI